MRAISRFENRRGPGTSDLAPAPVTGAPAGRALSALAEVPKHRSAGNSAADALPTVVPTSPLRDSDSLERRSSSDCLGVSGP
jgi:hypothetical protein